MPLFRYKARDQEGTERSGEVRVKNADAVLKRLEQRGYTPLKVTKVKEPFSLKKLSEIELTAAAVKTEDMMMFCREMYALLKAGVPLMRCIKRLAETTASRTLRNTLSQIAEELEAGVSFSASLSHFPKVFDTIFVGLVEAGESSGQLDKIFDELGKHTESQAKSRKQVKSALRYPLIVITACLGALFFMLYFFIPKISNMFLSFGGDLPSITLILIDASDFLQNNILWIFMGVVIFLSAISAFKRTKKGAIHFDHALLLLPIFGKVLKLVVIARFAKIFNLLDEAGVPILSSFELSARAQGNKYILQQLSGVKSRIEQGEKLSHVIAGTHFFSPLAIEMLEVGEEVGNLNEMLGQVAHFYQEEADNTFENISGLMEPILMAVMGGIVLVLVLGVFMPMFKMVNFAKQK